MSIMTIKDPEPQLPAAQPLTPMGMLQVAVERGADINVLEKLMDLQERWERNQGRKAFDAAMSDAKAKIKPILKNQKVGYATKDKDSVDFDHEDLAQIAKEVDPILSEHGLSYRYRSAQDNGTIKITCVVSHRDGHSEETTLASGADTSGKKNSIQAIGSAITYLQRYTLKLALGLAAAKDDDAKASEPVSVITEKQVDELLRLADEANADKAAFCKALKVDSFPDIPATRFFQAKSYLQTKLLRGQS